MKVKMVLISLPEPKAELSPYNEIIHKFGLKIDFKPFSYVEGLDALSVRKQKIDFRNYTAVIFTSKNAVDNYFRLAEEMRFKVPDEMKYFCQSEAIALYLQKYIVYRKRKVYVGTKTFTDLAKVIKKKKTEKFLLPTSETIKTEVLNCLTEIETQWDRVILYNNKSTDIKNLDISSYDIIVFFSPASVRSLFNNFPDFKQNGTHIATFGPSTLKEAEKQGLKVEIPVPSPAAPSMVKALEEYVKIANK